MSTEVFGDDRDRRVLPKEMFRSQLVEITSLPDFHGWDLIDTTDVSILFEYKHAWREYHNCCSCTFSVKPETLLPARRFCLEIKLPFRFYVRWCARLLGYFPKPWELNYDWLKEEISSNWLELQHVKVPVRSNYREADRVLNALRKREEGAGCQVLKTTRDCSRIP